MFTNSEGIDINRGPWCTLFYKFMAGFIADLIFNSISTNYVNIFKEMCGV